MTAGQDFVKKIGPFGSALFLLLFLFFLLYAFLLPSRSKEAPEETPPVESVFQEEGPVAFELEAFL